MQNCKYQKGGKYNGKQHIVGLYIARMSMRRNVFKTIYDVYRSYFELMQAGINVTHVNTSGKGGLVAQAFAVWVVIVGLCI